MSNKHGSKIQIPNQQKFQPSKQVTHSLLDVMQDGREFESLINFTVVNVNLISEIRRALKEISDIRGRPNIMYFSNVVNPNISAVTAIEPSDDLPFSELVNTVPKEQMDIDVLVVTPGGIANQVAKFVDKLRPRFNNVSFILPNICMSAGTMFVMSGDEIIMTNNSYIGPIDPQVSNRQGVLFPAQSILTLIDEIKIRGEAAVQNGKSPDWTDLQILSQIDPKEIGNAITASKYSVEMVENYLHDYKFKTWVTHSDGRQVTPGDKRERSNTIADQLCKHSLWKSHGRGITREAAWELCRLKINHSELTPGLDRAIKRLWALTYWTFENTAIFKIFVSENYGILRIDQNLANKSQ